MRVNGIYSMLNCRITLLIWRKYANVHHRMPVVTREKDRGRVREAEKSKWSSGDRREKITLKFITFEINLSAKCVFFTFRSLYQTGHGYVALHGVRVHID